MKRKIRVLSIDGGGIRGIIPAKILIKVEELLQEYSKDPDVRLSDYFDLVAGTSTGSILAGLYLCPDEGAILRSKYSAKEVLDLYLEYGPSLFERSWKTKFLDYFGLMNPLYKGDKLEKMLEDYFGELSLEELVKPCLFPSYNVEGGDAVFFNQMNAYRNKSKNFLVREVIRASTAAPTYFSAARVNNFMKDEVLSFIDGGMFANNPALCAYIEACKFPIQPEPEDIMILSLGTGSRSRSYSYDSVKKWGKLGWVVPVIDIYGSASSQTVHHQLQILYQSQNIQDQYFRIEPNLDLFEASLQMDNVNSKNIQALEAVGEKMIEENLEELKCFVRKLYVSQIRLQATDDYRVKKKNKKLERVSLNNKSSLI